MNVLTKILCIILTYGLFIAGCATVPITGRRQLVLIPYFELQSLSSDNYRQILAKSKLSQDAEKVRMVNNIGNKIAWAAEDFLRENGASDIAGRSHWEFNLIEADKTVNAFAMPGGKIAVYTGILSYTQDEAGLAVVIAHEVAHVIANHGGERMSQMLLAEFGHTIVSKAVSEKAETTRQFFNLAYGASMNLGLVLPYSRLHEKEADRIGLILMARAGYDPGAAIWFWQRMNEAHTGSQIPEFLSTHPVPQTRIGDIKNHIPEAMKYYNKRGGVQDEMPRLCKL